MDTKEKKYSFRLKTHEAHTIKMLFDVLNHIIKTNAVLSINSTGVSCVLMDEEKRSFFSCLLEKDKFNTFFFDKEIDLTLDLATSVKMMKHIKKKDTLVITRYRDKPEFLEFKIKTEKSKSEHTSFIACSQVALLPKFIPCTNYGKYISVSSSDFYKNSKGICSSGNNIEIRSTSLRRLEFFCEDMLKKVTFPDSDSDTESEEKSYGENIYSQHFPSSYIIKIAKLVNLTPKNNIKIYLRDKNNKVNSDVYFCIKLHVGNLGMAEFQLQSNEQVENLNEQDSAEE